MNRRRLLLWLAAAALPLRTQAQSRMRRVAIVGIGDLSRQPLSPLVDGLWQLGHERGRNLDRVIQ